MVDLTKKDKVSLFNVVSLMIVGSYLMYCCYAAYDFLLVDHNVKYIVTTEMYENSYLEYKSNLPHWEVKAKVVSEDGSKVRYLTVNQEQIQRGYITYDERNRGFFNIVCVSIVSTFLIMGCIFLLGITIAKAYDGYEKISKRLAK